MSGKMLVTMKVDQRLMISQQLRQAITLLQYNTLDLKQWVLQCMSRNPMIEIDEESEKENTQATESEDDAPDYEENSSSSHISADYMRREQYGEETNVLENYAIPTNLRDHLLEQTLLCQFDPVKQAIAERIIDAIDDDGFLMMTLEEIQKMLADDIQPDISVMLETLKVIQTFDPIGVAACDIRESLLIQLGSHTKKDAVWETAYIIIHDHIEMITQQNTKKTAAQLGLSAKQYSDAINLIRTLNPHPGVQFSNEVNYNIEPELYVKKIKDKWEVFLADSILTNVKINKRYQELVRQNKKHSSYSSMKQELEEAKGLLSSLKRRNETLLAVGSYIVETQSDFLDHGPSHLRPLNIVDVATALGLHASTISRITTEKYIYTNRGVFELKYFFPSHVTTDNGDNCSDIAVKVHIKEIISREGDGHAYSDEEISHLLKEKGINVARRTVAKYREALKILPSYQRNHVKESEDETA